jgi:Tfp pilus assembly protein PilX
MKINTRRMISSAASAQRGMQVYTISQSNRSAHHHAQGFALVATVSMMVLMTLIAIGMLSLSTIEQRSSGGGANDADRMARANARMALMIALGELQKAAGPDQRVTATATILGSATNPYATGTTAADGRKHWLGVWNTNGYSPADPDNKTFVRWLVSGDQNQLDTIADAGTAAADDFAIFEGVDAAGNADPASTVKVPKVEVATATPGNSSYYAYWVEDEGVKVDLAWNQGSFTDADREQAARLSTAPGPDHSVFSGPFATGVSHPLASGSGYIDKLEKSFSPADMPLVMADTADHSEWLKANRHNMAMNVRGVIADVKKGGLRRDLSLAFEMDDAAESESAGLFNQQTTEFVGNGDKLSSPYPTPGTSLNARYLFRDYGPDPNTDPLTPGAGNPFSDDMTQPLDFVRGPSWWLLRDYANLYKRMKTPSSGTGHALSARAYFPNRSVTQDLVDLHSVQGSKIGVNHEIGSTYRSLRASYAPVLLAVNGIFSLKYEGDQLKLVVDPFYIIWNPYNTQITAEKFAITWQYGFMGGVKFRHTFPDGTQVIHGRDSDRPAGGSQEGFVHYAGNKTGATGSVSYLISDLTMGPGEVMIFSPPDTADRSANANEYNDELLPGMNYTTTSGIEFNEFPNMNGGNWAPITVPSGEAGSHTIGVHLSLISRAAWNLYNHLETSLPAPGILANQLTTEANFGDNLSGSEFSTNAAGTRRNPNLIKGVPNFPLSYLFSELSDTKKPFAMISMLTQSSDMDFPRTDGYLNPKMEVFSQLNVTPILRTRMEKVSQQPFNLYMKAQVADGYNNLINNIGVDIDAFGDGSNGFYGKNYALAEGDKQFPLLDIPRAPMHSLVQLSGANIGTRLFEPTNAIGNSWKPPYIPQDSIYWNSRFTYSDVFWQANDALFDRYYLSGIAPGFAIGSGGYSATGSLNNTLKRFYGIDPADPTQSVDPATAQANPALEPHMPSSKTAADIITELTPTSTNHDGYKKVGAYSMIKGAFNVNSTSVKAWRAFLQGNKALALESVQGTTESGAGTPFPLSSTTSAEISPRDPSAGPEPNEVWEEFSRLTDDQIWDDNDTPSDLTDDTGLAVEIVNQVKARGPFMSISDFVNRRIGIDSRSYQGAIQEAIEQADINGGQSTGIRAGTSDVIPNYKAFSDSWKIKLNGAQWYVSDDFPYAADPYLGNRNCSTGIPLEINQANILLPLAPRLSARSDTFRIRAYGEVRDADDNIIAQATCEAVVQRLPEYLDPNTDAGNNEPWDDDSETPTLNPTNQTYGRRFEIRSFRWLDQSEV